MLMPSLLNKKRIRDYLIIILLILLSNAYVPKFQTETKLMDNDLGADHLWSKHYLQDNQ